jgi:hypothetical protein
MIDGLSGFEIGLQGCAFSLFVGVAFPELIKLG